MTKLHLENFQDHKDTTIDLKPGINLITGSSDVGKSALLRGFNFLMHNLPKGTTFIHCGETEARVTGWFSDGVMVNRIKGDRNAVHVRDANGNDEVYDRFGHDLPDDVIKALGNPPMDSKHGPIAYAEQMASLFLVSLSSTELPRTISELTGIDDFEEAAKALASQSRQSDRKAKESEARLKTAERELEQYEGLDEELAAMARIDEKVEAIDEASARIAQGRSLVQRYNLIMSQGREASKAMKKAKIVVEFASQMEPIREKHAVIERGRALVGKHEDLQHRYLEAEKSLESSTKISRHENVEALRKAYELNDKIHEGRALVLSHRSIMNKARDLKAEIKEWSTKTDCLKERRKTLVEEMRTNGLWCAECDRPLAEDDCAR